MNFKIARIRKGIKQIDLAREIHISPSTLLKWEKGIDLDCYTSIYIGLICFSFRSI